MPARHAAVVFMLLALAATVAGQPRGGSLAARSKPAWLWSDEERLAARFDPRLLRERIDAFNREQQQIPDEHRRLIRSHAAADAPADFVAGRRNPELLMRWELFNTLIATAYGGTEQKRDGFRRMFRLQAERGGLELPPDYFERIERAAHGYIAARAALEALGARVRATADERERAVLLGEIESMRPSLCPLRAEALANTRASLGVTFDRFLYTAVAPGQMVESRDPIAASRHLFIERGCR